MQRFLAASELPSVVEWESQGPGGFRCGKVKAALISILNKLESLIYLESHSLATFEISLILQPTQFLCPIVALHFHILSSVVLHEVSKQPGLYTNNLSTQQIHPLSSNTRSSSADFSWTIYILSCSNNSKLYRQQNLINVGVDLKCVITAVVKKKNW